MRSKQVSDQEPSSKSESSTENIPAAASPRSKRKRSAPKKAKPRTLFSVYGKVFRINNNILEEIRKLQCSVLNLIPKLPFSRLVREILQEYASSDLRIQHSALLGLQVAAEMYMTDFFEDSYLCTLHAKRITLLPRDMQLAKRIRGHHDIINK